MNTISTHILDSALGKPASGVSLQLEQQSAAGWQLIASGITNQDGRVAELTPQPLPAGHYRLTAQIGDYFSAAGRDALYLSAQIDFALPASGGHYHLPFLISPWSWSTYRGS